MIYFRVGGALLWSGRFKAPAFSHRFSGLQMEHIRAQFDQGPAYPLSAREDFFF